MAMFRFNLDGVLRHRRHIEQEKQRALAEIQQKMTALQSELNSINDSVSTSTDELRSTHLTGPIDMAYLTAHRRFVFAMRSRASGVLQDMARLGTQLDAAQKALAAAARECKIIEKLREKQHTRWMEEQQRKELALLDEIGMQLSYANLKDDEINSP